jgi:hypothetical protein
MSKIACITLLILFVAAAASADPAESLEQAKTLSADSGKPILMEFVHED